jgi:hypothetical protein
VAQDSTIELGWRDIGNWDVQHGGVGNEEDVPSGNECARKSRLCVVASGVRIAWNLSQPCPTRRPAPITIRRRFIDDQAQARGTGSIFRRNCSM